MTHAAIDATLALIREYDIKPDHVKEITVFCGETEYRMCTPLEIKCKPRTIVDAQFSIPWVVATAIVKRKVSLDDFTEGAIKNNSILRITQKVKAQLDSDLMDNWQEAGRIRIVTNEGTYTKEVKYNLGVPENPMTYENLKEKFYYCVSHPQKPLSKKAADRIIKLIENLEELEDVTEIIRLAS